MQPKIIKGRVISKGTVSGEALLSEDAISFSGGVNLDVIVVEIEQCLEGQGLAGKVLVFLSLKGSAAGMWLL